MKREKLSDREEGSLKATRLAAKATSFEPKSLPKATATSRVGWGTYEVAMGETLKHERLEAIADYQTQQDTGFDPATFADTMAMLGFETVVFDCNLWKSMEAKGQSDV